MPLAEPVGATMRWESAGGSLELGPAGEPSISAHPPVGISFVGRQLDPTYLCATLDACMVAVGERSEPDEVNHFAPWFADLRPNEY